jgi:excisionase family DNA binding protein
LAAVLDSADSPFMSVKQVSEYLQLNEKKIYALVREGSIPATKVTGKWMFPRELVDRWMLSSAHGGLHSDRLVISGSDDPLLRRLVLRFARESGAHALVSYTPTGTRLGLDLLHAGRADLCALHWGPDDESHMRHPALLRQYAGHDRWILVHLFRRQQGLLLADQELAQMGIEKLLRENLRWARRQPGAGAGRYFLEVLGRHGLSEADLQVTVTAHSEQEAAAAVAMGEAEAAPGVAAAAREHGLAFLPLGWEAFDLAMPRELWFRRLLQALFQRLQSSEGAALADSLGGYDLARCGTLVWGQD